jgi:hypothetical protein
MTYFLTLALKEKIGSSRITYLKEMTWKQDNILIAENGMAALTFCNVPISIQREKQDVIFSG